MTGHGIRKEVAVQIQTDQVQHNEQRAEAETENLAAVLGQTLMALTASEAMNYRSGTRSFRPSPTSMACSSSSPVSLSCGKNIGGSAVGQS